MLNELSKLLLAHTIKAMLNDSSLDYLKQKLDVNSEEVLLAFEEFCNEWDIVWHDYAPTLLLEEILISYEDAWNCELIFEDLFEAFPEEAQSLVLNAVGFKILSSDRSEIEHFFEEYEIERLHPQAYFEPCYAQAKAFLNYCEKFMDEGV